MFSITLLTLLYTLVVSEATSTEPHPLSDEFIDLINSEQTSWRAGRNFAEDTPLDYYINPKEIKKINFTADLEVIIHPPEELANLPEEFDPRTKWPNCPSLNDIRDEGACRSSWAFAAVAAMTDRYCIFSNGTKQFNFSAQDLISCSIESPVLRCHSGYPVMPKTAWLYWITSGIVSGGDYYSKKGCRPYEIPPCDHKSNNSNLPPCNPIPRFPKCESNCINEYNKSYENDKRYGLKNYTVSDNEDQIKAELYNNGPVQALIALYYDFLAYKSGVYSHTKGHFFTFQSVKIIGWGVENNIKYWLVANSWNSNWGDKGYFKIVRGENHCGIEKGIVAGIPKIVE